MPLYWDDPNLHWDDPGLVWDGEPPGIPMKILLNVGWKDLDEAGKLVLANTVKAAMTGNAAFPNATALITALGTALSALTTAQTDAETAEVTLRSKVALKNSKLDLVGVALTAVADHVSTNAGTPEVAVTSGFALKSGGSQPVELPAPRHFHLTLGDEPGEVDVMCDAEKTNRGYLGEYRQLPSGAWTLGYAGRRSTGTIKGLTSGEEYEFRMALGDTTRRGPASDVIRKRVA
jgi:hypothetical protein